MEAIGFIMSPQTLTPDCVRWENQFKSIAVHNNALCEGLRGLLVGHIKQTGNTTKACSHNKRNKGFVKLFPKPLLAVN